MRMRNHYVKRSFQTCTRVIVAKADTQAQNKIYPYVSIQVESIWPFDNISLKTSRGDLFQFLATFTDVTFVEMLARSNTNPDLIVLCSLARYSFQITGTA